MAESLISVSDDRVEDGSLNKSEDASCLVFCSAGERIFTLDWLQGLQSRENFATAIVYYGKDPVAPPQTDYFLQNTDFKIPNFLALIAKYPEVLEYDYYIFIDDDIQIESDAFSTWLSAAMINELAVSQPALTADSRADWPHLKQQALDIDFGQFVEVQCFMISRNILRLALPFFYMIKTGTGLDIIIYLLCSRHKSRMGVLHNIPVNHPYRDDELTVRRQFTSFGVFNQRLSRSIEFCFEEDPLEALAFLSNNIGDTRYGFVRFYASCKFVFDRLIRKIRKIMGN